MQLIQSNQQWLLLGCPLQPISGASHRFARQRERILGLPGRIEKSLPRTVQRRIPCLATAKVWRFGVTFRKSYGTEYKETDNNAKDVYTVSLSGNDFL